MTALLARIATTLRLFLNRRIRIQSQVDDLTKRVQDLEGWVNDLQLKTYPTYRVDTSVDTSRPSDCPHQWTGFGTTGLATCRLCGIVQPPTEGTTIT